jgi:hypothetical protein
VAPELQSQDLAEPSKLKGGTRANQPLEVFKKAKKEGWHQYKSTDPTSSNQKEKPEKRRVAPNSVPTGTEIRQIRPN